MNIIGGMSMHYHIFSSKIFHNIIRICVVISGLFFMGDGCKDPASVEKDTDTKLIGKWKLTKSVYSSDSIFIGSSWIEMKPGKIFTSNTSFFWKNDSTRFNPLSGSYQSTYYADPLGLSRHAGPYTTITLQVNTRSLSWVLYGLTDSDMEWTKDQYGDPSYKWSKIK
jgi:hypothetical protein